MWPSCHICEMWMCGLRVIYVLLAIEQAFFCRFSKPPRAGEVLPKFCTYSVVFLSEVSIYMFVYCFGMCGRPADTNEIAFILCSISRGVRTRPLLLAAGGRLVLMATRVRSTRGLVAIRSMATLGCLAALLRVPGTRTRTSQSQGRPCGRRG